MLGYPPTPPRGARRLTAQPTDPQGLGIAQNVHRGLLSVRDWESCMSSVAVHTTGAAASQCMTPRGVQPFWGL